MTITDCINKAYFLTKTNATSFPAANMLLAINNAYNRVISIILQADGRWQWDDNNQTDFPVATAALVADQNDYQLSTTHLKILDVHLKDSGGLWRKLKPIDSSDYTETPIEQVYSTTGVPVEYDALGSSVVLYPTPNFSQSASLKIYYQRGPAEFTSDEVTTGTKVPGFSSLYHDLIPLWVAYDYALANGGQNINVLLAEIQRKEAAIVADYARRHKDERKRLTMGQVNFQ